MKSLALALILVGVASAQTGTAPNPASNPAPQPPTASIGATPSPANAPDTNAKQARQILDRTLQALGGKAYLTYFDLRQQGRGFGFNNNEPQGVGIPFTRYYQYPDKERYDYFRQGDWVILRIGDKGYETTWRGTKPEDPKSLAEYNRRRQFALDYILRGWLSQPTTAYFYDGNTIAETKQVHKITLMDAKNQSVTLFIDTKTFLPVKRSYTYRDPETRDIIEEEEMYDQYRDIQGIMTPHTITRKKNGDIVAQRFLRSVAYNVGVGDSKFIVPELKYDPMKK